MHIYVHIQINITVGREKSEAVKQVHYYHVPICRLLPPHWSFHTDTVHCEYIGRNPTLLCLKQWEEVPCNWVVHFYHQQSQTASTHKFTALVSSNIYICIFLPKSHPYTTSELHYCCLLHNLLIVGVVSTTMHTDHLRHNNCPYFHRI